jgi:hypothetical protein
VPALVGRVDDGIVRCFVALLDFAYLARRNIHDTATLLAMDTALRKFHVERLVFVRDGVCDDDSFSLPRQHALVHFVYGIRNFGSPNGLDSSITESKHIDAVKKPWRRSNRNHALEQILVTNTKMYKLGAARIEFGRKAMLDRSLDDDAERIAAARDAGVDDDIDNEVYPEYDPDDHNEDNDGAEHGGANQDVNAAHLPWSKDTQVILAKTPGKLCV